MSSVEEELEDDIYEERRPTRTIGGFKVSAGIYDLNGATVLTTGVNFTIHTRSGTSCTLLLYHRGENEPYGTLPIPEDYKIGDVYSMFIYGLDIEELEYGYQVDGPYDRKKGLIFDSSKVLLDPYARAIAGQKVWGEKNSGTYHGRVVREEFDWGDEPHPTKEMCDLIIYELHIRGFTINENSGVEHRGTFAGLQEKIPYLKELGINAVELMPIFEFDEEMDAREVDGKKLIDYWGYNTVGYFAPNASYAAHDDFNHEGTELKTLIKTLHENGIEVILDVVFNHTAEGNENGPTFCFKGLDNNVYYMLTPEGFYYNFSGCGNTLNCNHPVVQQMILECLRYWTINYRIDGFRFDLASILGRNEDGSPMNNPPLLRSLAYDPILSNVKLIAEAWDAGGMYQVGTFPASGRWAEWNGRYRDSIRSFLKGGFWDSWTAAWSIAGSGDLYGGFDPNYDGDYAGYDSCINFITCHDGFTMYDLYAYDDKHNDANGWNGTDGADDNRSWNCGVEGDTDDPDVLSLRFRMIRNACAVLLCSRGTPMFLAGDEFGRTKQGNNNTYCQDNELSWIDWSLLEKNHDLFEFFQFMIAYRKKHPVIGRRLPNAVCGMEPLQAHDVDCNVTDLTKDTHTFSISFAGYDRKSGGDDLVYISVNAYWEDVTITLPDAGRYVWYLSVDTYGDDEGRYFYPEGEEILINGSYTLRPRSVAIFTGRRN